MPSKDMSLLALDIWVDHPKLSFPDALAAAYSMVRGYELATFDAALSRMSGVSNYVFN
jgi:predicted nucleic acid-binding protein